MDNMPFAIISSLVRHGLTTLGGLLMATDFVGETEAQAFVGAGMTLAGIGWSIMRKWLRKQRTGSPS